MMAFDNFRTIRHRNEYSSKQVQTVSLNLTTSPVYLVKLKIAQKRPTAYCSAFCGTECSEFSQKVVQCSFLSVFGRKFF